MDTEAIVRRMYAREAAHDATQLRKCKADRIYAFVQGHGPTWRAPILHGIRQLLATQYAAELAAPSGREFAEHMQACLGDVRATDHVSRVTQLAVLWTALHLVPETQRVLLPEPRTPGVQHWLKHVLPAAFADLLAGACDVRDFALHVGAEYCARCSRTTT